MRTSAVLVLLGFIAPAYAQFYAPISVEPAWKTATSDNFRVFHTQDDNYAHKALELAEEYRDELGKHWFGPIPSFRGKCDLYLWVGSQAGPGSTRVGYDNGQAISFRIDIRIDLPIAYESVLPHEIMHALLGAHFGRPVPRWIDEGLASQVEPNSTLTKAKKLVGASKIAFDQQTLMTIKDYPHRHNELFYAQSTITVNHLIKLKDRETFMVFVDHSHRDGYEKALKECYKLDYAELEKSIMRSDPVEVAIK